MGTHPRSPHPADGPARHPRRRDRRGRGLRGPLVPAGVPLARSRSQQFDDLVLDSVERLDNRWSRQLDGVEFAVEEVPPGDASAWSDEPVPLARLVRARGPEAARIVLYRRPLEARAGDRGELGTLIHDVVVEQVAELLDVEPHNVDPHYGDSDV